MALYIYNTTNATITPAEDCVIVRLDQQDVDLALDGGSVRKTGTPIGDPDLAVWYTPKAIREAADDDLEDLTDEELVEVAAEILSWDRTWKNFHEAIQDAVDMVRGERTGGGTGHGA